MARCLAIAGQGGSSAIPTFEAVARGLKSNSPEATEPLDDGRPKGPPYSGPKRSNLQHPPWDAPGMAPRPIATRAALVCGRDFRKLRVARKTHWHDEVCSITPCRATNRMTSETTNARLTTCSTDCRVVQLLLTQWRPHKAPRYCTRHSCKPPTAAPQRAWSGGAPPGGGAPRGTGWVCVARPLAVGGCRPGFGFRRSRRGRARSAMAAGPPGALARLLRPRPRRRGAPHLPVGVGGRGRPPAASELAPAGHHGVGGGPQLRLSGHAVGPLGG